MALTPGYKQTEVGVIPEEWDCGAIESLIPPHQKYGIVDGPFGSNLKSIHYRRSGIPIVSSGYVTNGVFRANDYLFVDEEKFQQEIRSAVKGGDIVMAKIGARCGASAILPASHPLSILSGNALKITIDETQHSTFYVWQVLRDLYERGQLAQIRTTGAQPAISLASLKRLRIPLPPKHEQEAIAEALRDADALVEALEQLVAKKRLIKRGVMQELLTGKRRLAGFSGEWKTKPLGELFDFSGGFSASRDQLSAVGYCYLHYGDIHGSRKTFIDVRSEYAEIPKLDIPLSRISRTSLLEDGDVVFVDASEDDEGTSRHIVIINPNRTPFISGLHTIVAKAKTLELDHGYRRYCFQTSDVKRQFKFFAVGTKVSGISKTNIAKVLLPVPDLPEQTAIAVILSDMDAEIAELEERLAKARLLKQGMMQELLTGRIRLL